MKKLTLFLSAMLLACATNLWAESVTFTVTSAISVSTSGTAPSGSSATFTNTYTNNKEQLTSGNSMTLTLEGYAGYTITGITLSMKSNSSKGAGYLSVKAGTTTLASIGSSDSGVKFNDAAWYGDWSTSYVDVTPTMTNNSYAIQADEDVVIVIGATANSLYCQSFTITYEKPSAVATPVFTAPVGAVREDGTFGAAFDLTISCETEGASVYYTLDKTDPKESATKILLGAEGKVSIPAVTTRVRAIATKGTDYSAEKDVTYTFDLGYVTSIADFIKLAPTKSYELRFTAEQEAVIIGAKSANLYIQDNSGKGIILYCGDNIPTGAVVGTKIVGSLSGTYTIYKKQPEMTSITWADGVQFMETSRPTPVAVEAIDETTYNAHPMVLVKIEDVTFASSTSIKKGEATYSFFGTLFGATTGKVLPESTTPCDITGILSNYDGRYTIYPVETSDIDTKGALAELPTFTPAGGATQAEATEISQVTITPAANTTVTINGDTYTAAKIFNITEEYVEMQVTAKHDFYTDNSTTVYYKAVPSITIEPTGDVAFGTIRKDANMAESAKTLTVKGTYLAEAIKATLSDGAAFTLSASSLPAEGGKLTITPVATVGANEAVLTLASGKYTATLNLSATIQDVYTITWSDKGETFATTTVVEGETVVLPANTPTCSTKEFVGWTALEEIPENATAADMNYITAATIPTADATYRAVFATITKGESKSVELTQSSFELSGSYAVKTATVDKIGFTIDEGFKGNAVNEINPIQMNSSRGKGILYNTTAISGLESITLNVASGTKVTTIYQGTAQQPSTDIAGKTGETATISFAKGMTYFCLKVSGATYFSSIVINYTPVAYSEFSFTCSSHPTDMQSVAQPATAVQKTIENGQLIIIRDGVKYNAMGVRL